MKRKDFVQGSKDSLAIVIGYFSVSFTFGIVAAQAGITPAVATFMSLTNVTSAGQFAGLNLIFAQSSYFEMILTQLIINLRYGLMSLSLSQHLDQNANTLKRLAIAFANTDEIFAVSVSRPGKVSSSYMAGLEIWPVISWAAGTFFGAFANNLLPAAVSSALGIALYGMFVAIVMPVARERKSVAGAAVFAAVLSLAFHYLPVLKNVSSGFSIIICTVAASAVAALFFPIPEDDGGDA
ncbi:MAG: branched-chain amino acid ABC transporter permease [Lachnospiraceae bacterium]|uniref:AzlC family ABC transporter permease n=1 Tax=Candidatus Weimeria bifida TaxID=2599074 RepID=A0A6N7J136_9FIRM|nr:AzlC family ABC transporter permease [Candidatus Weimeria bifida]RRF97312.1 MAG: branched-chain amino acid ABC transporter permease [Lachnospiraceae bacterium]